MLACPAHQQAPSSPTSTPSWHRGSAPSPTTASPSSPWAIAGGRADAARRLRLHRPAAHAARPARRAVVLVDLSRAGPRTACVLLRAMCGGWQRPEMVGWDDDRLAAQRCGRSCGWRMGITRGADLSQDRPLGPGDPAVSPRPSRAALPRIEAQLTHPPGLFLGGNAYRGVALNDCTEQGGNDCRSRAGVFPSLPDVNFLAQPRNPCMRLGKRPSWQIGACAEVIYF